MHKVLLLNGPNLNLLGRREPDIYGHTALAEIESRARALGQQLGLQVDCLQSNAERSAPVGHQSARKLAPALLVF